MNRIEYLRENWQERRDLAALHYQLFSDPLVMMHAEIATHRLQLRWGATGLPWKDNHPLFRIGKGGRHVEVFYHFLFTQKSDYYAMMALAGGCKDPFCDPACVLQLVDKSWCGVEPRMDVELEERCGKVVVELSVECLIPKAVHQSLLKKNIIQQRAQTTQHVVCPT